MEMNAINNESRDNGSITPEKRTIEIMMDVYTQRMKFIEKSMPDFKRDRKNAVILPKFKKVMENTLSLIEKYSTKKNVILEKICCEAWELFYPFLPIFNNHSFVSVTDDSTCQSDPLLLFNTVIESLNHARNLVLHGGEISMFCSSNSEEKYIEISVASSHLDILKINDLRNAFDVSSEQPYSQLVTIIKTLNIFPVIHRENFSLKGERLKEISLKLSLP